MSNVLSFNRNPAARKRAEHDAAMRAVTVGQVRSSQGSDKETWNVTRGLCVIGQVERFQAGPGEEHPFKAFGRPYLRAPMCLLGMFYASEHGGTVKAKQMAVDTIAAQ